jgi:GNAT acetyltransferase-like protein
MARTLSSLTTWDRLRSPSPALAALQRAAGTPVTSRPAWWYALGAGGGVPVLITVCGRGGTLTGTALIVMHREAESWRIASSLPGSDDAWEPAALSAQARGTLLGAVAEFVSGLDGAWTLELTGLRDKDDAALLAGLLPHAEVDAAAPVPLLRFGTGAPLPLADDLLRSLARSGRRLRRDRSREEITVEREPSRLLPLWNEITAVHLACDDYAGRPSELDDPVRAEFWRRVYHLHTRSSELEVVTLRLGGDLAAYVAAIGDGSAYRVIAGRSAPKWRPYTAGRRLETRAARWAGDDGYALLDWGSSVAPETLLAANDTDPRWTVRAASTPDPAQ